MTAGNSTPLCCLYHLVRLSHIYKLVSICIPLDFIKSETNREISANVKRENGLHFFPLEIVGNLAFRNDKLEKAKTGTSASNLDILLPSLEEIKGVEA